MSSIEEVKRADSLQAHASMASTESSCDSGSCGCQSAPAETTHWRSLEEIDNPEAVRDFVEREFPVAASEFPEGLSRRNFLQIMSASVALAGLSGCRRPAEKIVPYVKQPEEVVPGIPSYYATAMPMGLEAFGLLVKSNEGKPTKIEGNEKHPASLGSAKFLDAGADSFSL